MPIYEYLCETCGREFEEWQRFSDAPVERCSCGGRARRLISQSSFILKGTGWYVTDYGRKDSTWKSSSKTTSTETKPAESSTPKPSSGDSAA
jgi:putative FmdB family regulatory protein